MTGVFSLVSKFENPTAYALLSDDGRTRQQKLAVVSILHIVNCKLCIAYCIFALARLRLHVRVNHSSRMRPRRWHVVVWNRQHRQSRRRFKRWFDICEEHFFVFFSRFNRKVHTACISDTQFPEIIGNLTFSNRVPITNYWKIEMTFSWLMTSPCYSDTRRRASSAAWTGAHAPRKSGMDQCIRIYLCRVHAIVINVYADRLCCEVTTHLGVAFAYFIIALFEVWFFSYCRNVNYDSLTLASLLLFVRWCL